MLQSAFYLAWNDHLLYHGTERQLDAEVIRIVLSDHGNHPAHAARWPEARRELEELWELNVSNARGFLAARTPLVAAPVLMRRDGVKGPYPEAIADFIAADYAG